MTVDPMSRVRRALALSVSAAALAAAAPALAQVGTTPGAPPAAVAVPQAAANAKPSQPPAPTASDQSTAISEVIVTAEKRAVNIQNVPVAVTAFTAKQRQLEGINTIQDLTSFTPGFSYSSQLDRPVIRGLARNNSIFTGDSSVGVYDNDLYSTSTYIVGRDDLLVDQVEILLGPQNTLYGRNSIGGLINTHSRRPSETFGGEVRAIVGNYSTSKFEGTVTGAVPYVDGLTFRLSGYYDAQDRGYFRNLGGKDLGGIKHDPYIEAQLQYKHGDDEIWFQALEFEFHGDRSGPGSLQGTPSPGPYDLSYASAAFGLLANGNYAYSGNIVPGSATGALTPADPTTIKNRLVNIGKDTNINNQQYVFNLHYTHNFDGFDLKYVGGYTLINYYLSANQVLVQNSGVKSFQVPTVTGIPPLTVDTQEGLDYAFKDAYYSQEIDLTSTTKGPFSWIAGLYYFNEKTTNLVRVYADRQPQLNASGFNVIGLSDINQYIGSVLGPRGAVPAPARAIYNPNQQGDAVYQNYEDLVESEAVFGQASYKLNDQFKITGGVRYTYDHKRADEQARYISLTALPANLLGALTPGLDVTPVAVSFAPERGVSVPTVIETTGKYAGDAVRKLADHSSAVTGTLALEWTPDAETLAYARYNRGYKAFGFTGGVVGPHPEAAPEAVNDYEVGLKRTFARNIVVDLAGFYYDYTDDQISLLVPVGASGTAFTQFLNIPKAVSAGFEVTALWTPVPRLNFSLTYGFDHTEIKTDCPTFSGTVLPPGYEDRCFFDVADPFAAAKGAKPRGSLGPGQVFQSVKGDPLPNSPENKVAFNTNYTFYFDPGSLTLSGTYTWRDNAVLSVFDRRQYDYAPSWSQVDLRATWAARGDRYEVVAYVKNLFDTTGYNSAAQGFYNALPQGGAGPAYTAAYDLTPPRLFGAELHYKF